MTYVHGGVDLADGFVVSWELIDLHSVAHQLTHYFYFELVQLTLGDCVCFGNNRNDVDLREKKQKRKEFREVVSVTLLQLTFICQVGRSNQGSRQTLINNPSNLCGLIIVHYFYNFAVPLKVAVKSSFPVLLFLFHYLICFPP